LRIGRPKKWKKWKLTSVMIPSEYEEVYKKAEDLARIEAISLSEIIAKALKEYVEVHYPGNPQLTLPSITGEAPRPLRLEARFESADLRKFVELLESGKGSTAYRSEIREKCKKLILKLSRLNQRLKDEKIEKLIERAVKAVDENTPGRVGACPRSPEGEKPGGMRRGGIPHE